MPDPILIGIAASLAAKSAGSLYDSVRATFKNRGHAADVLAAAEGADPKSPAVEALANETGEGRGCDPTFREGLRSRWDSTSGEATHGGTVNQIAGNVGELQARDIQGNVGFFLTTFRELVGCRDVTRCLAPRYTALREVLPRRHGAENCG